MATNKLDALKLEPWKEPVTQGGSFEDGFRWSASIAPHGGDEDREAWAAAGYEVTVLVFWGRQRAERRVELRTLRLVPKDLE